MYVCRCRCVYVTEQTRIGYQKLKFLIVKLLLLSAYCSTNILSSFCCCCGLCNTENAMLDRPIDRPDTARNVCLPDCSLTATHPHICTVCVCVRVLCVKYFFLLSCSLAWFFLIGNELIPFNELQNIVYLCFSSATPPLPSTNCVFDCVFRMGLLLHIVVFCILCGRCCYTWTTDFDKFLLDDRSKRQLNLSLAHKQINSHITQAPRWPQNRRNTARAKLRRSWVNEFQSLQILW